MYITVDRHRLRLVLDFRLLYHSLFTSRWWDLPTNLRVRTGFFRIGSTSCTARTLMAPPTVPVWLLGLRTSFVWLRSVWQLLHPTVSVRVVSSWPPLLMSSAMWLPVSIGPLSLHRPRHPPRLSLSLLTSLSCYSHFDFLLVLCTPDCFGKTYSYFISVGTLTCTLFQFDVNFALWLFISFRYYIALYMPCLDRTLPW